MYTGTFKAGVPFQTNKDKIAVVFDAGAGSATLQYSADGEVWTDWTSPLTDANVIICNIPRGLYLKFSGSGKFTAD